MVGNASDAAEERGCVPMTLVQPSWDDARAAAQASVGALPSETVPLERADRRVLAADVHALTALPPRDASAMDGWAVSGPGPWSVGTLVRAGHLHGTELAPGHAVPIATGAAVPTGTTGVLRSEDGRLDDQGRLHGERARSPGHPPRRRGGPVGRAAHRGRHDAEPRAHRPGGRWRARRARRRPTAASPRAHPGRRAAAAWPRAGGQGARQPRSAGAGLARAHGLRRRGGRLGPRHPRRPTPRRCAAPRTPTSW